MKYQKFMSFIVGESTDLTILLGQSLTKPQAGSVC